MVSKENEGKKANSQRKVVCPRCGSTVQIYRNPLPTVDVIIEMHDGIVLVERQNPPNGWALPGGFVDYGESLEEAARREAAEETGLIVHLQRQLHTYSSPDRDPRYHTITTVFIAHGDGLLRAGDDAKKVKIFRRGELPLLVFDHAEILNDYFKQARTIGRP